MDESPAPDEHLSRLMARAQQGDSNAYVTLLRAITPRVRQLVRSRRGFLGDSDVEDVVQEVLLALDRREHIRVKSERQMSVRRVWLECNPF